MNKFDKICKNIKEVKIQGASRIAKTALYAYSLKKPFEKKQAKERLLSLRPTEPMLMNVLNFVEKWHYKKILAHFDEAQKEINEYILKIIKNNSVIFTHCHSTNVINALIYAKKKGKKFQVYVTETRPLYQGRQTAKELRKSGIKVTMITDLAAGDALTKAGKIKKADIVFLGADALLKKYAINKIGSNMFAEISYYNKIPVYIIADSWKYSPKNVKLEERDFHEVWKYAPKHIKIKNPAFEKIPRKYIKAVVSELGILSYRKFIRVARKEMKKNLRTTQV